MKQIIKDKYAIYNCDCVEGCKNIPTDSVGLIVTSVPFASVYTYSDDPKDFSNAKSYDDFFTQMDYLIPELYRILTPGRTAAIHCQNIATFKGKDGEMGLIDFRGDLIRAFQKHKFVYGGEITLWANPQAEAIRTKSASLLNVSFINRAEITRTALASYVILMRKTEREDEGVHVIHEKNEDNFKKWTRYASSCWGVDAEGDARTPKILQTKTLNVKIAKNNKDEKHLCPLQLDLIHYLIDWKTNPGEIVFDPFGGVMSVPYQALLDGRKALATELKEEYFDVGSKFLEEATNKGKDSISLIDLV